MRCASSTPPPPFRTAPPTAAVLDEAYRMSALHRRCGKPDSASPGAVSHDKSRHHGVGVPCGPSAIPCGVAGGEDEEKVRKWWPSEPGDAGETAPYTVPSWMDQDVGEPLDPGSAEPDDTAEEDEPDEALVASCVELAMQNLQRHKVRIAESDEEEDPLRCFGSGDAAVYAIEDGAKRLMIGRAVGRDGQGCIYCLVGTGSPELLAMLDSGEVAPTEAFDDATELTLCTVFQADEAPRRPFRLAALNRPVSNVVLVERYRRMKDVPAEYHPGQPFLQFTEE